MRRYLRYFVLDSKIAQFTLELITIILTKCLTIRSVMGPKSETLWFYIVLVTHLIVMAWNGGDFEHNNQIEMHLLHFMLWSNLGLISDFIFIQLRICRLFNRLAMGTQCSKITGCTKFNRNSHWTLTWWPVGIAWEHWTPMAAIGHMAFSSNTKLYLDLFFV